VILMPGRSSDRKGNAMSNPAINPYQAPLTEPKLTSADAADIKRRSIGVFVLLCIITLGIYWFYLVYHWAKEVNGLVGRAKYPPLVVLLVNILTCGLAGLAFECLFAFDVAETGRRHQLAGRMEQLGMWVIIINCVAILIALIPLAGIPLSLGLGTLASVLVQMELNRLADAMTGHKRS
jgi:uncharacterized protein DUF4234